MTASNTTSDAVPGSNTTGKDVEQTEEVDAKIATESSIEAEKLGSDGVPTKNYQATEDKPNRVEALTHKEEPTFPPPEVTKYKARSPSLIPTISTRKSPSIKSGTSPVPSISSLASLSIYSSLEDTAHAFHIPPEPESASSSLPQLPKTSQIAQTEAADITTRRPLSQRVKSLVAGIFHDSIALPKKVRKTVAEQEQEMHAKCYALYSHQSYSVRPHHDSFSHAGLPERMRMMMRSTLRIHGEDAEDEYGGGSSRRGLEKILPGH